MRRPEQPAIPIKFHAMNTRLAIPLFFILLVLFADGCSPCEYEEVMRIKSPDSKVEAVHVRGNCGATTPFTENVFIVPLGDKTPEPKADYAMFLADHTDGLKIVWRELKILEIHYNQARIFKFTNFWHSKKVDDFSYVVEIRLVPLKPDFSLPERYR